MPSVLFVCMANRFRSPLAAAFFWQRLEERGMANSWSVSSAGLWAVPGLPALDVVAEAARAYGIDLSTHRSKCIDHELLAGHDLVLVMEAGQREALATEFPALRESVRLLSQAAEARDYDITDVSFSREAVEATAADLDALIRSGLESICALAVSLHEVKSRQEN